MAKDKASTVAPTADGAALPNANPAQVRADEFLERARKDATLANTLREIDTIVAGDTKGAAYAKAKALSAMQPSLDDMINWYPGSTDDSFERAVTSLHNELQPEQSPNAYSLLSRVLLCAVCASDEAVATEARIGQGTSDKPQFKFVRTRSMVASNVPADKRPKDAFVGSQADAKAEIDNELSKAKAANAKDTADAWQSGKDAINNVANLRRLGSDLAALGMRKNRWRRVLYVSVAQHHLDEYANSNPSVAVGKVWSDALAKAADAHKRYINEHGPKGTATTEGLSAAIKAAVWDEFLKPKVEVQGRKVKSEDEERKALVSKLWNILDAVDKEFTTQLAKVVDSWRDTYPVEEVAEGLKRPSQKRREASEAEQRAADEKTKADAEAEARRKADEDKAAREQRAKEREEKKAQDGGDAATTSGPKRRMIARPAS